MKKILAFVMALSMVLAAAMVPALAAAEDGWVCPDCRNSATGNFCDNCGAARPGQEATMAGESAGNILDLIAAATGHALTAVEPSPDKYTWYVKDYVGQNVSSVGYTSLGGDRLDAYGAGYLQLVLVTKDGTYVDINNEDMLKKYVVIGQNLSPNTELKYTFMTDSEGKEYDNLVSDQNYDSIDLLIARLDGTLYGDLTGYEPFAEDPADRYTHYIRNYVGKNLASVGYTSLGGDRFDAHGAGYLQFVFTASDGSSIDVNNEKQLAGYVITGQDIPANAAMTYTFMTDSEGKEYSNLVSDQTYEKITFSLKPVSVLPEAFAEEETAE